MPVLHENRIRGTVIIITSLECPAGQRPPQSSSACLSYEPRVTNSVKTNPGHTTI